MKDLFFCPELWRIDPTIDTTVARKCEVRGFDGTRTEAWQLGDWFHNWSTIRTEITLQAGEEYSLRFWLNGGENSHFDEICQLEIYGEGDWVNRETIQLTRSYAAPQLHKNGWYLFSVPFTAPADCTVLRFHAMAAVTTLAAAAESAAYASLASDPEPVDKPQRHNIVFENGWPKSDDDPAFVCRTVTVSKGQLKTAMKIAGGITVGLLVFRAVFKKSTKPKKFSK